MSLTECSSSGNIEDENKYQPLQLAVLIASTGSATTFNGLVEASQDGRLKANINLVVSNKLTNQGQVIADKYNISSWVHNLPWKERESVDVRRNHSTELAQKLSGEGIEVAVLAGWPIILEKEYFEKFHGITLNVHPGWIPSKEDSVVLFPDATEAPWNRGLMTDEAVAKFLEYSYAGSTIHVATPETDFGPVLKRICVRIKQKDTVESLYPRLKVQEQKGLIHVLNTIQRQGIKEFMKSIQRRQ